jgi:hypothetical protein
MMNQNSMIGKTPVKGESTGREWAFNRVMTHHTPYCLVNTLILLLIK